MSNKSTRKPSNKVIGRLAGEPESSALNDESLMPGVSIDGAPPLIGIGDSQIKLVSVLCSCGTVVAELFLNDRRERTGKAPFWYLVAAVTDDIHARPPVLRHVENLVAPGTSMVTDCPAHGRQQIDADKLLRRGRTAYNQVLNDGRTTTLRLNLARVS